MIIAPYDGQRISPAVFNQDNPFKVEVFSDDADIAKIELQRREKGTDGVWMPWPGTTVMTWQKAETNQGVEILLYSDRVPVRRVFTFDWPFTDLGVGEYALRAVASDSATRLSTDGTTQQAMPNEDLDAPIFTFLVDGSKPIVLTSTPDYQARESERLYRGELSVLFNDDMRAGDFTDRTFYVTDLLDNSEKVAGFVSYSPALRKAIFVPQVPFKPNGFFRVEVKTDTERDDGTIEKGVHDLAGNPLDSEFTFTFRTTDSPFEETWTITLSATDGISTDANNIAAVAYSAIDGEDEQDARAVPSLTSQFRLSFLDRDKVEFDRDIRPADGRLSHHWFFMIANAQEGSGVRITYEPSIKLTRRERQYQALYLVAFDSKGNTIGTTRLDPRNPEPYEYISPIGETVRYFRLDVQKASLVATEFWQGSSGWKFFSVPIIPQRADPFVNLGDDIEPFKLYKYDTKLNGYKIYPLDIGEVSLQTGRAYFTRLSERVEIDVGGASNNSDLTLTSTPDPDNVGEIAWQGEAGWHAIGNPFVKPVNVANLMVNGTFFSQAVANGLIEGTLYRWKVDPTSADTYEAVTANGEVNQLQPWEGYWLKTLVDNVTLTIPQPAGLNNFIAPLPEAFMPPLAPPVTQDSIVNPEFLANSATTSFALRLALTSDFASDLTTTFGTREGAKVGKDKFDTSEPPALSQTVTAYFSKAGSLSVSSLPVKYNTDYQPPLEIGESRTWELEVYTDKPDAKMRLSWEDTIEQVPDDTMLYIRIPESERRLSSSDEIETYRNQANGDDIEHEWQDMRKVRYLDLPSESQITKIRFEIRAERFEMKPVEDLSVVPGEKQVVLKWAASDNEFIEGYTIYRKAGKPESQKAGEPDDQFSRFTFHVSRFTHEFIDTDVEEEATYTYLVSVHYVTGAELKSELFTVTVLPVIKGTVLLQSYPNPFNPETWIPYELSKDARVTIEIYNVSGQLVRTLDIGAQPRGRYISKQKAARWDGRTQVGERSASGVYFYVLKAGNFVATRKMVIVK